MKPHILQIGIFPVWIQKLIDAEFDCHDWETVNLDPGLRAGIRGILTRGDLGVPEDMIVDLPKLGVISVFGVGYDKIPLECARDHGVLVANTPNVLNAAVAELTVGLLLSVLRDLPKAHQFVVSGRWSEGKMPLAYSLEGKCVGILGLGRIGKEIASRLRGFGVRLVYHGRTRQDVDLEYVDSMEQLARMSDILIVAAPGGPDTAGMIDKRVLAALGPRGYLVNIARGSLIDEDALIAALENHEIAGAALDVFADEPDVNERFFALDNVVLTPHIASATYETRRAMAEMALDNLRQFFKDGTVIAQVMA